MLATTSFEISLYKIKNIVFLLCFCYCKLKRRWKKKIPLKNDEFQSQTQIQKSRVY